jgi:hypothetical protein
LQAKLRAIASTSQQGMYNIYCHDCRCSYFKKVSFAYLVVRFFCVPFFVKKTLGVEDAKGRFGKDHNLD